MLKYFFFILLFFSSEVFAQNTFPLVDTAKSVPQFGLPYSKQGTLKMHFLAPGSDSAKFLMNNGSLFPPSWETVVASAAVHIGDSIYGATPYELFIADSIGHLSQLGFDSGKYLYNDGHTVSWQIVTGGSSSLSIGDTVKLSTNYELLNVDGSHHLDQIPLSGTSNYFLESHGTGSAPSFVDPSNFFIIRSPQISSDNVIQPIATGVIPLEIFTSSASGARAFQIQKYDSTDFFNVDSAGRVNTYSGLNFNTLTNPIGLYDGSILDYGDSGFVLISQGSGITARWANPNTLSPPIPLILSSDTALTWNNTLILVDPVAPAFPNPTFSPSMRFSNFFYDAFSVKNQSSWYLRGAGNYAGQNFEITNTIEGTDYDLFSLTNTPSSHQTEIDLQGNSGSTFAAISAAHIGLYTDNYIFFMRRSNNKSLTIQPPTLTKNWTWTLPDSAGVANYVLTTDGTGVTTWQPVSGLGAGTVTSVAASGGTTGLSFTGSPITTSGTLTLTGTLNVANGGTGATSLTSNAVLLGNGTSAVANVAVSTHDGQILWAQTAGAAPIWTDTPTLGSAAAGGSITLHGSSSGLFTIQPVSSSWTWTPPADGGTNHYVLATDGTGVTSWVPQNYSFGWSTITADQTASVNNGYINNKSGSELVITLPASAAVGDEIKIMGRDSHGFKIAQGSGQIIHIGALSSTSGATGYVEMLDQWGEIDIRCIIANTTFSVSSSVGNITKN